MITLVKKITILLLIQGTFLSLVHADEAQDMKNFYNTLLPDFQKLTPEASALGQYGKYSNSGYTGVPNIPISLLTIGSGDFSMPIELSYDASGIKVEQHATYVGLGWNLIMGGSINQILCGQNDFRQKTYSSYPSSNLDLLQTVLPDIKYIQSPYAGCPSVRFESLPYVLNGNATGFPLEEDKKKYDILRDVSIGAIVPDIFQASFCGKSVSFTIDTSSKKARIIDNNATNYKIELKEYTGNYPHSIEITDDHGLKYIFTEAPKNSMEDQASYNLSKIKNYANHILAEFKYSEVGYTLLQPYYETIGKRDESYNRPIASQAIQKQFIDRNYPQTLTHVIKDYYPSTIITDKEIVTFIYGDREDIKGTKKN